MKLPKPGTKIEDLKCSVCRLTAAEQPDNIKDCEHKDCPFKKMAVDKEDDVVLPKT